jgi:hypothetical protein
MKTARCMMSPVFLEHDRARFRDQSLPTSGFARKATGIMPAPPAGMPA